jgi:hypothetical protein
MAHSPLPTHHLPNSLPLSLLNQSCWTHDNVTSLPLNSICGNSLNSNQNIKKPKQRRFSDPGPTNSENIVHLSSLGNTDEPFFLVGNN